MSDDDVRLAAFDFLRSAKALYGDVLPFDVLSRGFTFRGERVPLLGPQGIFKPRAFATLPLSITTAPEVAGKPRPYDDRLDRDGLVLYRYRGENPLHHENVGLRMLMEQRKPLIYLRGIVKGRYLAEWPVYIVGDDPQSLSFRVAIDDRIALDSTRDAVGESEAEIRRRYITVAVQKRMHQVAFRERVIRAYRTECTVCRLKHAELLDAAHILPDHDPQGRPEVPNGLALCKLHHAAFDQGILGIRPDHVIEIREDVLLEIDGPMLKHGLQAFQGQRIRAPGTTSLRPKTEYLERRYEIFRRTG